MLWGHILPYPKDGLSQPKHRKQLLVSYETFDRQTASRERLVLLLYDFLFSDNTITFTYHPLFELFFHHNSKLYCFLLLVNTNRIKSGADVEFMSNLPVTHSQCQCE